MKYLYLDDEEIKITQDIVELLMSEDDNLEIVWDKPKSFGEEIRRLKEEEYDGLIFDLRLDQKSEAEYRALTLAQEVRTRATEGSMKNIPIVVCSTDKRLKASYNKDSSGHDLFDMKYLKTDDLVNDSERVAKELISLAKGYQLISEIRSTLKGNNVQLDKFVLLKEKEVTFIDKRFFLHFGNLKGRLPVHEYATFIFKQLVLKPGLLIDKNILSARLGVAQDSTEFNTLIDKLNPFKYKGPFNDNWERWWWPLINNWFKEKGKASIAFLNARERVDIVKKITKLSGINPATAIETSYSSKFWSICEFYNLPLDPYSEGVMLEHNEELLPWQENKYISLKAAFNIQSRAEGLIPHASEKERLKLLSKLLENE